MMKPPVVFVTGATATGKSAWALEVAEEAGAVIVNCDSVQVYRGPVIGSNVPGAEDRAKVPHFLYSYVDPPREMTAGDYRRDFMELMEQTPGERVMVVGGTGFYFQALEKGMFDVPDVAAEISEAVRAEWESAGGPETLWRELQVGDSVTANRLQPADGYRICRAVELLRSGVCPSELRASFKPQVFPFPLLKTQIVRDSSILREQIAQRTRRMLENGLIEETRMLLEACPENWAPLQAVGYKETVRFLKGGLSKEWLVDEISLRTAQLAKRQANWFKRDQEALRFDVEQGIASFREACLRFFEGADRLGPP